MLRAGPAGLGQICVSSLKRCPVTGLHQLSRTDLIEKRQVIKGENQFKGENRNDWAILVILLWGFADTATQRPQEVELTY